jgi:hypothetical protein
MTMSLGRQKPPGAAVALAQIAGYGRSSLVEANSDAGNSAA